MSNTSLRPLRMVIAHRPYGVLVAYAPAEQARHPYSLAIRDGDNVTLSGRLGADRDGALTPGGFPAGCVRGYKT